MPGLVGFISDSTVEQPLLAQMVDSITHEPWYKVDRYVNPPFHVARVHLGIFNPEPQPVFNEDRTLCLFMDGKVYGYDEDKKRLEGEHHFSADSDPEFCLHLYEELGAESFKRLNGNFVLVILDLKEKKAIIANDRNTLRPLYYAEHNGALLFGPEAKAILQDRTFKRDLDVEALAMSLAFGGFWGDRTLFAGIHYLPPASVLTYSGGRLSRARYWELTYQPDYGLPDGAIVEQVIEATRRAVAIRSGDRLRYGVSLSGGLDSRSILWAIEPEKRKSVTTFSYGPLDCGEVRIAERVARKCGTSHRPMEITPHLIIQNAERGVWLSEGRMSVWLGYMYPAYKLIRGDVDVVLDGFGFDATLGGSYLRKHRVRGETKEELYRDIQRDDTVFGDDTLLRLFAPKYRDIAREAPLKAFEGQYGMISTNDPRTAFDEFWWRSRLVYISTSHVYAMSQVEISCPTVDNDLIALIYRIPPEKRANHYIYRQFLKQLSPELARIPYNKTLLPPGWPLVLWNAGRAYRYGRERLQEQLYRASKGKIYIRNRYKYVDEAGWLRVSSEWKEYFGHLLLDPSSASREYVEQDYIRLLIQQHEDGTRDNGNKILRLATFELFLRQFLS
jgi:asparagine synthase (glutamine-hydrolysing)